LLDFSILNVCMYVSNVLHIRQRMQVKLYSSELFESATKMIQALVKVLTPYIGSLLYA